MRIIILILVIIAALCVIASGVWVAVALMAAISRHQTVREVKPQTDEENHD